jgi:hypothetical protein
MKNQTRQKRLVLRAEMATEQGSALCDRELRQAVRKLEKRKERECSKEKRGQKVCRVILVGAVLLTLLGLTV